MTAEYADLVRFAVVYLLPLIPAIIVFLKMGLSGDRDRDVARGALGGWTISLFGGSATYVAFLLIAIFFYGSVFARSIDPGFSVQFVVELRGDQDQAAVFVNDHRGTVLSLTTQEGGAEGETFRVVGFEANPGARRFTASARFPNSARGKAFRVQLSPSDARIAGVTPTIILRENVEVVVDISTPNRLQAPLPSGSSGWVAIVAALAVRHYAENLVGHKEYRALWLIRNEGVGPLHEIVFTDNRIAGVNRLVELSAHQMDSETAMAGVDSFRRRDSIAAMDTADLAALLYQTMSFAGSAMHGRVLSEIGFLRQVYEEDGVPDVAAAVQRGAVELRARDTTFRVGPVPGGVQAGQVVAVSARLIVREGAGESALDAEIGIGHRFPRPTRLAYLLLDVDRRDRIIGRNSVRPLVTLPTGGINPPSACPLAKNSSRFAICEFAGLPEASHIRLNAAIVAPN